MTSFWQIAEAKAKWSELLNESLRGPQFIRRRDEVVGVVMNPALYAQLESARAPTQAAKSMGDWIDELKRLSLAEHADVDV